MTQGSFQLRPATGREQVERARELVLEYVKGLGIDLDFQGFEAQMRRFPGDYAPPGGCLLLAEDALSTMHPAIGLSRALGFQPTAPYYCNPLEGALLFELKLYRRSGLCNNFF